MLRQGVYVIQEWTSDVVFNYVEAVLASWSQFATSKTVKKTEKEVIEWVMDYVPASLNLFLGHGTQW